MYLPTVRCFHVPFSLSLCENPLCSTIYRVGLTIGGHCPAGHTADHLLSYTQFRKNLVHRKPAASSWEQAMLLAIRPSPSLKQAQLSLAFLEETPSSTSPCVPKRPVLTLIWIRSSVSHFVQNTSNVTRYLSDPSCM